MKKAVILHGTASNPNQFWFPWLTKNLEKNNYRVWVPLLPHADKPDLKYWLPFVLKSGNFTKDAVLIGHSAGCPLILALLEKIKVQKVILVAGYLDLAPSKKEPILKDNYDWEKIKSNCREFVFINSDDDPWGCDHKQGLKMWEELGGTLILRHGEGHMGLVKFNQPYDKFPLLLKLIL